MQRFVSESYDHFAYEVKRDLRQKENRLTAVFILGFESGGEPLILADFRPPSADLNDFWNFAFMKVGGGEKLEPRKVGDKHWL